MEGEKRGHPFNRARSTQPTHPKEARNKERPSFLPPKQHTPMPPKKAIKKADKYAAKAGAKGMTKRHTYSRWALGACFTAAA